MEFENHVLLTEKLSLPQLPSLEAARLVMLGNLMPPKMHHSYTEIMVASEGAGLTYTHTNNYEDLNEQGENDAKNIAKEAYEAMEKVSATQTSSSKEEKKKSNG